MRVLVRSPNWVGDQIMAYPFFHYLREALPNASITVACAPWVESLQFRGLIDEVVELARPMREGLSARLSAMEETARALKARGPWDLGVALPNSFSSAWMLFRAGARARRGYRTDGRGWLLTEKLHWDPKRIVHRGDAYLALLPQPKLGVAAIADFRDAKDFWGAPPLNDLDPGVPGVISAFDPAKLWPEAEPLDPPANRYWVLAPGAVAEARRWPIERFIDLTRRIVADTGEKAVIVGGPSEALLASRLCEELGDAVIDFTAQGSVASLWPVFRHATFTLANDSGLAHVAALLSSHSGPPVFVVWGAGEPRRTEPLGPGRVKVVFNPVECWPCERNSCPIQGSGRLACLKGVYTDAIWEEIQRFLRPPDLTRPMTER